MPYRPMERVHADNRNLTQVIQDGSIFCECSEHVEENYTQHIIPRQSLTTKQLLMVLPQQVEVEEVKFRQLDHSTGKMVEGTDNRVTWRSDRTLLSRGKPGEKIGTFTRITSHSKVRRIENEDRVRVDRPDVEVVNPIPGLDLHRK